MRSIVCIVLLCCAAIVAPAQRFDVRALQANTDKRTAKERAEELIRRNNHQDAIPLLETWLRAVPADADAVVQLSACYSAVGRIAEAKTALETAAAIGLTDKDQNTRDYPYLFVQQTRWGRARYYIPPDLKPGEKYRLILLLHGNGHTPEIMLSWARSLGLKNVIYVCPEAPYLKVKESLSGHREKYSAAGESLGMADSLFGSIIDLSEQWYESVCRAAMRQLPVSQDKPIVVGFSQGGFYANVLVTRHPELFSTMVSICASMYPAGKVVERYDKVKAAGIDVLVTHGTKDETVPFQTGELIAGSLTRAGVNVTFIPFDGGHWPTPEVTEKIAAFIKEHLK